MFIYLFLNHTKSISRTIGDAVFACASLPRSLVTGSLCLPQLGHRCAQPPQPLTWLLEIRILVPLHIKHSCPLSNFLSPRIQTLTVSSKVTSNSALIVCLKRKYLSLFESYGINQGKSKADVFNQGDLVIVFSSCFIWGTNCIFTRIL